MPRQTKCFTKTLCALALKFVLNSSCSIEAPFWGKTVALACSRKRETWHPDTCWVQSPLLGIQACVGGLRVCGGSRHLLQTLILVVVTMVQLMMLGV